MRAICKKMNNHRPIASIEHLQRRLKLLDNRLRRKWPHWSDEDYIAVKFLLNYLERLLALERDEAKGAEGEKGDILF